MRGKGLRGGALVLMTGLAILGGCGSSSPDRSAELRQLLEEGDADEVLARVQLHRADGESGPWLDWAEGMAHLSQNADRPAQKALQAAVAVDPTLAAGVAERYRELAEADLGRNWRDRAARRMREAFRHDPTVEMGPLTDAVGDLLYRFEKDYEGAYPIYRKLAEAGVGPEEKQMEWNYRYGYCLQKTESPEAALEVYRDYVRRWPDDKKTMRYVQWRRMQLLLDYAEVRLETTEVDAAMELVQEAMEGGWHPELQRRCRVMAGRIEEAKGDPVAALDWYREAVDMAGDGGGEVVEDAKARIDALAAQGVH